MKKSLAVLSAVVMLVFLAPAPQASALSRQNCKEFGGPGSPVRICLTVYFTDGGAQWKISSHNICAKNDPLGFTEMHDIWSRRVENSTNQDLHEHYPGSSQCWGDNHITWHNGYVTVTFRVGWNNWPDDYGKQITVNMPAQ